MTGRPKEFDRSAVLAKALDCFWQHGYEGASLAMLVKAMGVGRQSAYDTFGGKRKLFAAALDDYAGQVTEHVSGILSEGDSPLARIQNFFALVRKITADGRGCLMTNSMVEMGPHDPAVRKFVTRIWAALEDALSANLQAAVEQKQLRADLDPRATARLLLTVMQGSLVLSKAKLRDRVADATRTMETLLLRA